jgi:predicted AAA+ superfamily ATPase
VVRDLQRKMVFLGGPRQVGKTTLARSLLGPEDKDSYLNWDDDHDRERLLRREFPAGPLWILDEIHKYKRWRNWLKGIYDKNREHHSILVTGSARLDFYRFGGDSLQGRYHFLRLHPLTAEEVKIKNFNEWEQLFRLSGFPEPFFGASEVEGKRWSRDYRTRLLRDDLSSLEKVEDLTLLEQLMLRLPELVGSPLSINSLREDLQVSHRALSRWLTLFERVYAIYRLSPLGGPKIHGLKKAQKHYHFDWTLIKNEGARFENMIGSHLLAQIQFLEDTQARELELRYFRDQEKREVDFVVVEDQKPLLIVECKLTDGAISPHLHYLKQKFPNAQAWQLSHQGNKDYVSGEGITVAPAWKLLKKLSQYF